MALKFIGKPEKFPLAGKPLGNKTVRPPRGLMEGRESYPDGTADCTADFTACLGPFGSSLPSSTLPWIPSSSGLPWPICAKMGAQDRFVIPQRDFPLQNSC